MLAPVLTPWPTFPALLFGLSGCLVDFGARAANSRAPGHEHPQFPPGAAAIRPPRREQSLP
ncbi:HAD family phosphatase, partial [Pseudomonas syringae]